MFLTLFLLNIIATDAASWIVQLSSDSPDINVTLDPDHVTMRPDIVEPSSSNTVCLTCDSQGIPAYSLYIGIVVYLLFYILVLVSTLAGILTCLYFRERHKNDHIYDVPLNVLGVENGDYVDPVILDRTCSEVPSVLSKY